MIVGTLVLTNIVIFIYCGVVCWRADRAEMENLVLKRIMNTSAEAIFKHATESWRVGYVTRYFHAKKDKWLLHRDLDLTSEEATKNTVLHAKDVPEICRIYKVVIPPEDNFMLEIDGQKLRNEDVRKHLADNVKAAQDSLAKYESSMK